MYCAKEIAYYLIDHAYKTNKQVALTGLKMNCYLFLIQGVHLAVLNKPSFSDRIIKTDFGIMIKEVYKEFKAYPSLTIPRTHTVPDPDYWGILLKLPYYERYELKSKNAMYARATYMCDRLDKETEIIIERVFELFAGHSLTGLNEFVSNMCCYNLSDNIIDLNIMKAEFRIIFQKDNQH